ncbi:hypothetical protein [Mesorhizobium sp. INR15]|uniref:hypothetical protein n=1 Tax=Mesorhizobium sp. INR15 TaxID=2654248 RepID=UPI0018969464|nr:hypothetical protein [Mesorhizobium sp. INR15]QPC91496.1 hypothetical protein GA829_13230 [Mesorhizobium sp. INR15]
MLPTSETTEAKPRITGRPSKVSGPPLYEKALYKVLLEKLPSKFIKFGRLDTQAICDGTGNARFTIYRWLNEQKLSKNAIRSLLTLSFESDEAKKKGKLKKADLIPFFDLGDDL